MACDSGIVTKRATVCYINVWSIHSFMLLMLYEAQVKHTFEATHTLMQRFTHCHMKNTNATVCHLCSPHTTGIYQ